VTSFEVSEHINIILTTYEYTIIKSTENQTNSIKKSTKRRCRQPNVYM